jgi:hypothetical protein
MNSLAMSRRRLDVRDGARNETLTAVLEPSVRALGCLLALLPATALAVEGSAALELGGGNKTLLVDVMADVSIVPRRLYLVTGYTLIKEQNLPPDGALPGVTINPVHLFQIGLDFTPSSHWLFSASFAFSPKATNTVSRPDLTVSLEATQRSLQGFLAVMYQSANFETFDWSVDATVSGASNYLTATENGPLHSLSNTTPLYVLRPALGFTATLATKLDLSLRGTYCVYSTDPTQAGKFLDLDNSFAAAATALSAILTRINDFSGYASAPSWYEARGSVLYRFKPRLSGQLGYTFVRYVQGHGTAHIVSMRWSWRIHRMWRLWISGSVQYDDPVDNPAARTASPEQQPFWSGLGTLGGELTYSSDADD